MLWVLIFAGIAVAGLVVAVSYAVWLWHKASDLFSEVEMLGQRVDELTTLLAQIEPTPAAQLRLSELDAAREQRMNLGGWEWAILALIAVLLIGGYRLGGVGSDLVDHVPGLPNPETSPTSPSEPEAGPSDLSQR